MRLIDNLTFYINDLNFIETTFLKLDFFKQDMEIINVLPLFVLLWIGFIFVMNILFKKNIIPIFGLFFSLLICGSFYSYLYNIKSDTFNKIKNDKIYNCALIDSRHSYISDEQFKCLRTKLDNNELSNTKLSFIEDTFVLNSTEIFKDLQREISYNFPFILIVSIIVYLVSRYLVIIFFGAYNPNQTVLIDGTETNPRDYQLFMIVATILYLLSFNYLNSTNINNKRLNSKILELYPNKLVEEVKIQTPILPEFSLLKDSIKNFRTYQDIVSGRIDYVLSLKLDDLNIDNFKSFMSNKDIENSYFTNILKYAFYQNNNLSLDNKDKQSVYYVNKANTILKYEIKYNDAKFIKERLDFFGYYDNVRYDTIIQNREIKDLETEFYLNSVSSYKNNYCEAINATLKIDFVVKSYSKKDIQEIIRISEKYNCYNKYRTLKL